MGESTAKLRIRSKSLLFGLRAAVSRGLVELSWPVGRAIAWGGLMWKLKLEAYTRFVHLE